MAELTADIGPYDVRIPIDDTEGIEKPTYIKIDDELMAVSYVGEDYVLATRYADGTAPAYHSAEATVTTQAIILRVRIPAPPASGTWTFTAVDGVLTESDAEGTTNGWEEVE